MSNNILLASVPHLPELIEGKVCIFNSDGTYTLLNPSRYTTISDNFDPMNYSILIHSKYSKCIILSTGSERTTYLVRKKVRELFGVKSPDMFRVGDKIHIHSRRGIYQIISIGNDTIEITCNKWQHDDKKSMTINKRDFKCLAGGIHNYAE